MMTEKIWGTTEALKMTPMFELHRLVIKPMMQCSLHIHQFKHNSFYILDGKLYIDECESDFKPINVTLLRAGDHFSVGPSIHHRFRTSDLPCTALEMYYTEPLSEDIIRRNVGGPA
jgi:mannose-6-phosphate isomerase-like protein (cupin superfamily)